MNKWEEIFGRIFRGAFGQRAATLRGLRAAPKLTRAAGDLLAGQVARSTFRIFKNNLLSLPWIAHGAELDAAIDGARADLMRSWNVYRDGVRLKRTAARAEADWLQALSAFRRQAADLNRRIAAYNLKAPSASFRKAPLDAGREIGGVMRDY
jgi:hypothetical protein